MKHKNFYKKISAFASISLFAVSVTGCAKTTESPLVRLKGAEEIENHKEAKNREANENSIDISDSGVGSADGGNQAIDLYSMLDAPETYQSEVSDSTGKLKVYTDAVIELPEAAKVSAVCVSQHPFEQAEMELITTAFFGDADVYDARVYTEKTKEEWQAEIEKTQEAYETAPKEQEMIKVEPPFLFREEPIDPVLAELGISNSFIGPDIGSFHSFYGIVPVEDGNYYRYEMARTNSRPMEVTIKKISDISEIKESRQSLWTDYVSMKTLYSWLPDQDKIASDIGISMEDAKKISDEKVSKLNLPGMQMAVCEYAVEIGGHSGSPREDDLKNVGYCFHYTRNINGIPITYTQETGGFRDDANSEIKPWCYETLDVYVTKDGIDMVSFINQYDIGETKVNNLELMPFADIMAIYEKMMTIQNAGVLIDKRAPGEDVGAPPEALTYRVNRIAFGYSRIYDPQSGDSAGLLVPVWDFFGECEYDYGESEKIERTLVREEHKSFLTINAVDGTVINRQSGY